MTSPTSTLAGPPLGKDRAFWGMTSTQLLGAFNDNLFKQLVMLICVDAASPDKLGVDYQPVALVLFAIPFVMFSGFAGFLSDRVSKRMIVVLMKVAEIVIMLAGMSAFLLGGVFPGFQLPLLFFVLFMMSTQSAFFGPSKYGILPELFADRDLPQANGIIQMTTFVAIIFGFAAAGYGKEWFPDTLWVVSAACVGIAIVGTLTSLLIRKTPIAHPGLEFEWSAVAIKRETWEMLKSDKVLMQVLLVSSIFWFLGGVMQPTANVFGKNQLGLNDSQTSLLSAFMGIGIALGCVLAGATSRHRINFRLVKIGTWGLIFSLLMLTFVGLKWIAASNAVNWSRMAMFGLGFSGGLFIVPLQVFMQAKPPEDQRGRMIGAMNLINWLAICLAAIYVGVANVIRGLFDAGVEGIFLSMAVILLPVALLYRPADQVLSEAAKPSSE